MPFRLLNTLGPLVKALGLWPKLDIERQMRATEKKYKRNNWTPELLRALPPRAKAFNEDADLSLFGALVMQDQFLKSMDNAMALENLIAQHPEILNEKIQRPLFVLGLARTGTTLLQRLLSLHEGARFLPFWEGYSPFPRTLANHQGGKDGRRREAYYRLKLLNFVGPEFNKIHPSRWMTRRSATTSSATTSSSRPASTSPTCRATGSGGTRPRIRTSTACTSASCRRCSGSIPSSTGC